MVCSSVPHSKKGRALLLSGLIEILRQNILKNVFAIKFDLASGKIVRLPFH